MVTHAEILKAITDRKVWEDRQATWYKMRHEGLRRRNKPWANASDMHFPLGDMLIEKLKPFYISQTFTGETVATFTAESQAATAYQQKTGQWFDFQLKQRSNFEGEILIGSDRMLEGGKGVIKVSWDGEAKELAFESVRATHIIVPGWTGKIYNADWLVHVQHISKAAYKRLKGFKNDDETMASLEKGTADTTSLETAKTEREGLTRTSNSDTIILWETFWRDENGKIIVRTTSPGLGDVKLREDFGLPYNKGPFGKAVQPVPFFEINCESKDQGYYDSRGIIERIAPFETSLCKDWNTMKDYQTLTTAPMFYAKSGLPSTGNVRMVPGQILPFELAAVQMPPIPSDISASMMGTRQTAEQLVAVPDFGTGSGQPGKDKKTATEVTLIGNVMGQSTDLRARIFRRELGYGLNLAYAILAQYAAEAKAFYYQDEMLELPEEALGGTYRIEPSGSGDNYNKAYVMQKAVARFQMFNNDPFIEQKSLRKGVLEADDARLVKQLILDAGTQSAEQQEDQAQELSIMLLGFPAQVRPTDDDAAHFQSLAGFVQRQAQSGQIMSAETLAQIAQHAQAHADAIKKKNPTVWKQQAQQITLFIRTVQQEAQAAQAAQAPAPELAGAAMPGAFPQ